MRENFDGYKKCPYCGKLILNDANFCKHCNKTLINNHSSLSDTSSVNVEFNSYKNDSLGYKYGKLCIFLVIVSLLYSFLGDVWFQISHAFPHPTSTADAMVSLPGYSNQIDLKTPEQINIKSGKQYRLLIAQAKYSLQGVVVATNTNFWLRSIMRNDFDSVVPLDLGIVWGDIADIKLLKKYFKFKSQKTLGQARMLRWQWKKVNKSNDYITSHISHNHIIPANDNIMSALLKVKKWDVIKLDGYLVDIIMPNGITAYTSLSRSDNDPTSRGANRYNGSGGACEIFYVTEVQFGNKVYK